MKFTEEQIEQLQAPLDLAHASSRKGGGGVKLTYLEAWFVIAEANRIFGFDGWASEVKTFSLDVVPTGEPNWTSTQGKAGFNAVATCTVRVTAGSTVHEGIGSGQGIDYNGPAAAIEGAAKQAESDALKRALIKFGNPFGLALYDSSGENTTGKVKGKSLLGG